MTSPDRNEEEAGGTETAHPSSSREGRGWLGRNYTLVLILLVPAAIGLFLFSIMQVRRIEPPTPAELAYCAAQRFVAEGRNVEALHYLGVATRADPDRLDTALLMSRLRLNAGGDELARVRSDLEERLETNPDEDGVGALHALLALAYSESAPERAAEHEARATELRPKTAAGCYYRSVATPSADEAFAWLDKGLSLDPDHVPSLKVSALALHRRRRFDEMNVVLQRADEERPGDASTLFLVALSLRADGDPDAALAIQETVLRLLPQDPEAYRQRSLTHALRRDPGKAVMDAREAVALAPPDLLGFYRAHLSMMLAAAGQREDEVR